MKGNGLPGLGLPGLGLPGTRPRGGLGWQTMLADLALILFMVTAAAMGQPAPRNAPLATPDPAPAPLPCAAREEALALWRAAPGGPSLAAWLGAQAADPRQQLTISAVYPPGHLARALAEAGALARQAAAMGRQARLVIEPGVASAGDVVPRASLAFDRADPASAPNAAAAPLARALHHHGQISPVPRPAARATARSELP